MVHVGLAELGDMHLPFGSLGRHTVPGWLMARACLEPYVRRVLGAT